MERRKFLIVFIIMKEIPKLFITNTIGVFGKGQHRRQWPSLRQAHPYRGLQGEEEISCVSFCCLLSESDWPFCQGVLCGLLVAHMKRNIATQSTDMKFG